MLYEQKEKQKELFEEFKSQGSTLKFFKSQKGLAQNKIFFFQASAEKIVFFLIGLVLIIIVTFCLGVERGKAVVAMPRPAFAKVSAGRPAQPVQLLITGAKAPAKPAPATNINNPVVHKGELYTVRLATYINKKSAADETSRLRQSGFPAYIKASDKFYMICVGDYTDKKQADAALAALKKKYGSNIYIKTNKK